MIARPIRSIVILILSISICCLSACDLGLDIGGIGPGPGPFPPPTPVDLNLIDGQYLGNIQYWIPPDSNVSELSLDQVYTTEIIQRDTLSASMFLFSFDTSFVYIVPDILFQIKNNQIHLISDQGYEACLPQVTYGAPVGSIGTHVKTDDTLVYYHMSIQSLLPDSLYCLSFHGEKAYE